MLKIKSNINEFTIIFFWEDLKENKCWKILCSSPHFLSASAPLFSSLFCFCLFLFQRCPFVSFSSCLSFLFSSRVALIFSPKTFFSAQNNSLFSPKPFLVQPTPLFQPLFVLFRPLFFLFHVLPSKSPQMCSAVFVHASFSVSCQLLRPNKIFL